MRDTVPFINSAEGNIAPSDQLWVTAGLPEAVQRCHELSEGEDSNDHKPGSWSTLFINERLKSVISASYSKRDTTYNHKYIITCETPCV